MPSHANPQHDAPAASPRLGSGPLWLAVALVGLGLALGLGALLQRLARESGPQLAPIPSLAPATLPDDAVHVGGSGSCIALVRRAVAGCRQQGQRVDVVIHEGIGSGGGLAALADGALAVALVSRPLKPEELKQELRVMPYARSPVALALQPDNGVADLSLAQLADLLAGKVARWPDGTPTQWLLRERGDSSHAVLRAAWPAFAAWEQTARQSSQAQVLFHDRTMHATLQSTPGTFGWVDAAAVRAEGVPVALPRIDGATADSAGLAAGRWPWAKDQSAVTRARDHAKALPLLNCLRSPAGRAALLAAGALPTPTE